MMLYAGCETAYFASHFTSTFIEPVLKASSIGFVMVVFYVSSALSSILAGWLQKLIGHAMTLILGTVCHLTVLLILIFAGSKLTIAETPVGAIWVALLICAILWGAGDAAINTQLAKWLGRPGTDRVVMKSATPSTKHEERIALSSNIRMWQCFCAALTFFLDPLIPGDLTVSILTVWLLSFAIFCFLVALVLDMVMPGDGWRSTKMENTGLLAGAAAATPSTSSAPQSANVVGDTSN
jgi:MFS family permease